MSTSIFTVQTPAIADASDGPITLGTLFSSSADGQITHGRWYAPASAPGTVTFALFAYVDESTGTPLASKIFGAITTGTWNTVALDTPVNITAGTFYVAAVLTPDRYTATANLFSSAISNSPLTAPANDLGIPRRNGRFHVGAVLTYPSDEFGAGCYFVDVVYSAAGGGGQTAAVGTATETDTALPLGRVKSRALGTATETSSALALGRAKRRTLGTALETDTALSLGGAATGDAGSGFRHIASSPAGRVVQSTPVGRSAS